MGGESCLALLNVVAETSIPKGSELVRNRREDGVGRPNQPVGWLGGLSVGHVEEVVCLDLGC